MRFIKRHHLPVEVILEIMQHTATRFRFTSRPSVVQLAMVSSAAYSTVAPILYHTLIVTSKNQEALRMFTLNKHTRAAAERVCSYVRLLVHDDNYDANINFRLFGNLETVYGPGLAIRSIPNGSDMAQAQPALSEPTSTPLVVRSLFKRLISRVRPSAKRPLEECNVTALAPYTGQSISLRCIHVWSSEFASTLSWCGEGMRSTVFKASGYLTYVWSQNELQRFTSDAAEWVSVLKSLPLLTHLGLILASPNPNLEDQSVTTLSIDALVLALRTALGYSRIEMVSLWITGNYIRHRGVEIESVVQKIQDARCRLWMDNRPATSWDMWHALSNQDVLNGRNLWTESRVLSNHT